MPRELHKILESQNMASLSAAALQHEPPILGLHAAKKSVRLGSAPVVRLESTFHRPPLVGPWANLRGYQLCVPGSSPKIVFKPSLG